MSNLEENAGSTEVPTLGAIVDEYVRQRPVQDGFTNRLTELVRELLRIEAVDVHLVESRTKEVGSFREKVGRASKAYSNPLKEISDLSGIRIIAYYEDEVEVVSRLVEREFQVDRTQSSNNKDTLRPEEFGYKSIHYVVSLNEARRSLREWQQYKDFQAEIQVRTVLQHAWAAISHKLQYKREVEVPSPLRRKLNRLSALMELADEQFLSLRDATTVVSAVIESNLAAGKTDVEINLLSSWEFLRTATVVRELIRRAVKHGFEGIEDAPMRQEDTFYDIGSDLTDTARQAGLYTITQLVRALESSLPWVDEFFKLLVADAGNWFVDAPFLCELVLIGRFPDRFGTRWLSAHGWGKDSANRVGRIAKELHEKYPNLREYSRNGI